MKDNFEWTFWPLFLTLFLLMLDDEESGHPVRHATNHVTPLVVNTWGYNQYFAACVICLLIAGAIVGILSKLGK